MTNGIVLLNLGDRNAAEFSRLEVPGSYDKALGALTAGTYVNVYKWQYQGFALTASICTVEDKTTYLLLKDKTKGGEMKVYPDDTVEIEGTVIVHEIGEMLSIAVDTEFSQMNVSAVIYLYDLSELTPTLVNGWGWQVQKGTQASTTLPEGFGTLSYEYTTTYDSYRFVIVPSEDTPFIGPGMYHLEEAHLTEACGIMIAGHHYIISGTHKSIQMYKEE